MTTEKKTRTPRNPETIAKGLFNLPLEDKVAILKALNQNVNEQVKKMQSDADMAANLLKS